MLFFINSDLSYLQKLKLYDPFQVVLYIIEHDSDRSVVATGLNTIKTILLSASQDENIIKQILTVHEKVVSRRYPHNLNYFQNFCSIFDNSVISLLNNISWELRDSAVEFISSFFENGFLSNYAIEHKFVTFVYDKLNDKEQYVRSTSLETLKVINTLVSITHQIVGYYQQSLCLGGFAKKS
jgi:hypothetical protein